MTFARALIASDLSANRTDLLTSARVDQAARGTFRSPSSLNYSDTAHRRSLRSLLDGAGLAGALVKLAFTKANGELRYMVCAPVAGADTTARYVTVQDMELSTEQDRAVFRRVCLDTVVKLELSYSPAGVM